MMVDVTDAAIRSVLSAANVRTINKHVDVLTGIVNGLDGGVGLPDPGSEQACAARRAALLAPSADFGLDLGSLEARCDRVQLLVTTLIGDERWLDRACDPQLAPCDVLIDVFGLRETTLHSLEASSVHFAPPASCRHLRSSRSVEDASSLSKPRGDRDAVRSRR
jgi:hypothetical protein